MLSWESLYSIKVGGMAPHVSELSEALARRGHEVHIFTRRGDFDACDKINDVNYHRVVSDGSGDIIGQMDEMCNALFDSFEKVQNISGSFDIIHGHDWHPVIALNRIKDGHHIPCVLTIHSTEWGRKGNSFSNWHISKEISHREWLGCYESSRVIVTTGHMLEELVNIYSVPVSKIGIIPNGIIRGKLRRTLDAGKVKEHLGISHHAPMILFCGRISYLKGPDLLVEAIPLVLKKHKNAKFIFAGDGDLRSECERRAKDLGAQNACRFLGYISSPEKEKLINACDLVCVPSRNEPFGIIVLEAWDAKKPIVATEAVNIIRNFDDGILAYTQPESLAWCINRLIRNPDEMKKLGKAGQRRVDSEFGWDQIAARTEEAYNGTLRARN
ncbi:MAG TPA: glycosyltransferase family 4 protein [Methanotrichaceae archaeon]|nr:glycosyltransferase family 4 protein [Methanotrichaceae archaeon]